MKSIFFLLLLANILYAGYGFLSSDDAFSMFKKQDDKVEDVVRSLNVDSLIVDEAEKVKQESAAVQKDDPQKKLTEPVIEYAKLCSGPLTRAQSDKASLIKTEEWLKELKSDIAIKKAVIESVAGDTRYWVYIPPAKNFDAAKKMLAKLQAKKIDSFIMGSGENEMAISLGYFVADEQAKNLQKSLEQKGFKSMIDEITQNKKVWVVLEAEKASLSIWRKALNKKGFSVIGEKSCEAMVNKA